MFGILLQYIISYNSSNHYWWTQKMLKYAYNVFTKSMKTIIYIPLHLWPNYCPIRKTAKFNWYNNTLQSIFPSLNSKIVMRLVYKSVALHVCIHQIEIGVNCFWINNQPYNIAKTNEGLNMSSKPTTYDLLSEHITSANQTEYVYCFEKQ